MMAITKTFVRTLSAQVYCSLAIVFMARAAVAADVPILPQTLPQQAWPSPLEPQLSWALIVDQLEHRFQDGKTCFAGTRRVGSGAAITGFG